MDRRQFLQRAVAAGVGGAVVPHLAMAAGASTGQAGAAPGEGPYGPLATTPDENGLLLPEGFTSRVVATAGEPVAGTDYVWHLFPDGAATFPTDDGGWAHTVNSEVFSFMAPTPSGGVSAIRYDADGEVVDAYRILEGSHSNCAGGPTPWGTWLSCEEDVGEQGLVYECDPLGERPAVAHEALGRWAHEAVAVDPDGEALYLTQDEPTGLFYRFTPDAYPSLDAGRLEACVVADDGSVTWREVPDPSGRTAPTREQVPGATVFPGGEGVWYHDGSVLFTTKLDHTVHAIDLRDQRHSVLWRGDPEGLGVEGAILSGVDNVTVDAGSGDIFVAEDGGNMEVVMISPDGVIAPFVRIAAPGHEGSEVTGPCFSPRRDRLYFSSQRGPSPRPVSEILPGVTVPGSNGGVTYEVTGPFRAIEPVAAPSSGSPASSSSDDGGLAAPLVIGGAAAGAVALAGSALALRRRRSSHQGPPPSPD